MLDRDRRVCLTTALFAAAWLLATSVLPLSVLANEWPAQLRTWQRPQSWQRDTQGPILTLGAEGRFDDTHMFAPLVIREDGHYRLWYCGSRGTVAQRVFRLGLAASDNGRDFTRVGDGPVFEFGEPGRSVLTPTVLRKADGRPLREDGRLRMWFSSTQFEDASGLHTLHRTTSKDGIHWTKPSGALLRDAYAPTILRDGDRYRMWYTDVREDPWTIRHAQSDDGLQWRVSPQSCLVIDQPWEQGRLFYPTVIRIDDAYLMWYGSYWRDRANTTATGFAASTDGLTWYKHPDNPVLRPDPRRAWESHYVTSQSIVRLPDGTFRIWYASRKMPPFVNKYFALNTAVWRPDSTAGAAEKSP